MTLEEQFALAVKKQSNNVFKEAGMAAAMLKMLHDGITPISNVIADDIWDQPERWSANQVSVWRWLLTVPEDNIDYTEAQKKFLMCETVDEIFNIYWHLCWMYGSLMVCESSEELDKLHEAVDHCGDCYEGVALFAYQHVLMRYPMSYPACATIAHTPFHMEFVIMLEEILAATADGFVPIGEMTLSLQDI